MLHDTLTDYEFGIVNVRYDARTCRIIFRVKEGVLNVTAPKETPIKVIESCIDEKRSEIKKLFTKSIIKILHIGDIIPTRCFTIRLHSHSLSKMLFSLKGEELNIFIPDTVDMENQGFQKILKQKIIQLSKKIAEPYLRTRLEKLAALNGVKYSEFLISNGRSRLGVCNTRKRITLSVYLIFYPQHLVDYVILHELAHITEMNHGPRFHALCNQYCGGREPELQREFKQFRIPL